MGGGGRGADYAVALSPLPSPTQLFIIKANQMQLCTIINFFQIYNDVIVTL